MSPEKLGSFGTGYAYQNNFSDYAKSLATINPFQHGTQSSSHNSNDYAFKFGQTQQTGQNAFKFGGSFVSQPKNESSQDAPSNGASNKVENSDAADSSKLKDAQNQDEPNENSHKDHPKATWLS